MEPTSENEISIYRGGELSVKNIVEQVAKIQIAFPQLHSDFFKVFNARVTEKGFSDQRLIDATNYVIDNCVYPTPTIAQFLSYDQKIPVLRYEDMLKKVDELGASVWKTHKRIKFPERELAVWVHVDDVKRYNLTEL